MGSLYDLLKQRRMVRHYTGEPAPRDALERIVETVRRAPSAGQDGEEIVWPVPFWHVDAGAAMMLVLLAAIEEGLAAAVYGIFDDDEEKLRDLLRIPDDFTLVAGISIGYPLPDPGWSSKTSRTTQRRRAVDELVHWNAWIS